MPCWMLVLSLKPIFNSLICVGWMPEKLVKSSTTFYKIKLELISLGGLISAGDAVVVHPSNKLSSVNILLCRPNDVHSQIIKAQPRDIFAIHFKCLLSIYNLNVCTIILH